MSRFSFRPQLESLDGRCLPSGNPTVTFGDVALVAQSSVPQPVTITATKGFGDFTPGVFSASGGINDSGVYQLVDAHDTALPSPVVGVGHDLIELGGSHGVITLKCETLFGLVSADPLVFGQDGHWLIEGGTGGYADLKGEGEFHKLIDVSLRQISIELNGLVHSEPKALGGHGPDIRHSAASQAASGDVTLTLAVDLATETRTWTATGAIEGSGTAETVWVQFGAINSPKVSILQIDTRFTDFDGTGSFTIRRTIISTADGDQFLREGTWHVVDATGVYAGLRGQGKLTGVESGTQIVDTLTGVLTL